MSASSKAGANALFDLKSAALDGLVLLLRTTDLDALAQALRQRFGAGEALFDRDLVCLDLSLLPKGAATPDFPGLLNLLAGFGLQGVAVRGGPLEWHAAARSAGLAEAQAPAPTRTGPAPTPEPPAPEPPGADETWPDTVPPDLFAAADAAEAAVHHETPAQGPPAPEAPALEPLPAVPTLIVDKPLRSGQRVYARGADLVVMAVVSHGAEVIADGSIHVYAPLRGRALAGARGDTGARIFAARMEAQLLSIAGIWRTTETGLPADVAGQAAQVRLDGDRLLCEPLKF